MIAACLSFFSPCDYDLPRRHLAATLRWLDAIGVEAVLAQVVLPGQEPQPAPPGVKSLVYESSDVMFFKENLLNLAATATDADKLLFLDTDLLFTARDVISQTEELLDSCDICQPFGTAVWHTKEATVLHARRSAAFALSRGYEPASMYYHPGFAWAMTRRTWDFLGGMYDRHILGGGDIALAYSLDRRFVDVNLRVRSPDDAHFATTPSYATYRHRGASLRLTVGCLDDVHCIHRWHGDRTLRQYQTRGTYYPLAEGDEYPLRYRDDGLLEWTDARASEAVQRYFESRLEDG